MADYKDPTDRHATILRRLARALHMPAEAFLEEPPEGDAGEFFALVRLWSSIQDSQGRRRVLSVARQEAERSGDRECA